jgi:hypothetical protein
MDKQKIKQALIKLEEKHIDVSVKDYEDFLTNSTPKRGEVTDPDDHSHLNQSLDVSKKIDTVIHEHVHHLETINALSFEQTNVVEPGAIVSVNGRCMIIGISKPQFEIDGRNFIGVSTEAPIYGCLKGKKTGDEFIFNERKFTIEAIN